jgi:hypothetical protein
MDFLNIHNLVDIKRINLKVSIDIYIIIKILIYLRGYIHRV